MRCLVVVAVALTCVQLAVCFSQGEIDEFLATHNQARAATGSGMPALTWSTTLADFAQDWADQCLWQHNSSPYGENLYGAWGFTPSPADSVDSWNSEIVDWDCEANTCSGVCGHYTQVVWASTTTVGCGTQSCPPNNFFPQQWTLVVCNYNPPGNYIGQRPFPVEFCGGGGNEQTTSDESGTGTGTGNGDDDDGESESSSDDADALVDGDNDETKANDGLVAGIAVLGALTFFFLLAFLGMVYIYMQRSSPNKGGSEESVPNSASISESEASASEEASS